ncbi:TPA: DnaB-like helicase C-terminal domain-containing protein [Clostridium botulinum]
MNQNMLGKKYYDSRSACQVIGSLIQNPILIKKSEYKLEQDDFVKPLHMAIFTVVYNLAYQGVKAIGISEIETYLANNDLLNHKKIFENEKNLEWLNKIIQDANISNFEYYYDVVRKMSLLRNYINNGIDVKDILDVDEIDVAIEKIQREKFNKMSIKDIMSMMDKKNIQSKKRFVLKSNIVSRKAGDAAEELRKRLKENPPYGLSLESKYLNEITKGASGGKVLLETRDTGCGKTRVAIRRLLNFTASFLWDFKKEKFISNPNGQHNSGLYIGTEMDVYEELEPMMWAFISGVEESRILYEVLTEEENKRVDRAIKILEETKLYLIDNADFDISFLQQTIEEYKINYNIGFVGLDYIELNSGLSAEYSEMTKGMTVREDQVLLNLSKDLKNIAKKYDVFINAFTQTTDEARREHVRDQRAVKGARSLPNKVDLGMVVFEPDKKEMEKIQPIIEQMKGLIKKPNICYSIYKNRGGKLKLIRIFGYQDLGTMEFVDLFCTNWDYERINVNKINIEVTENDEIIATSY